VLTDDVRSPISRQKSVSFAGPYLVAGQDLLVRRDARQRMEAVAGFPPTS
jgi:hypothetical protein